MPSHALNARQCGVAAPESVPAMLMISLMTIGERELGASQIRETAAAGRDCRLAMASDQSISLLYWPVVFLKASGTVRSC